MADKWVGVFVLVALITSPGYFASAQSQNGISAKANAMCPSEDATHIYNKNFKFGQWFDQNNQPMAGCASAWIYNGTSQVAAAAIPFCTKTNLYGKPCHGPFVNGFCKKANFCDASISGSQCISNGKLGPCEETKLPPCQKTINGYCVTPASYNSTPADPTKNPPLPTDPTKNPPLPTDPTKNPPSPGNTQPSGAFNNSPTPSPQSPTPSSPSTGSQISGYANPAAGGSNPYGGYGGSPSSPSSPSTWGSGGFGSPSSLSPGDSYSPSESSQGYPAYPTYQAPTTFGGQYYPDGGSPSGGGFNPIASLFADLFPRPDNPIVNFFQSFIVPAGPSYLINIRQISLQLLPDPIPRQGIVSYPLTPPSQSEINKYIIAIAQQDANRGTTNSYVPVPGGTPPATGPAGADTSVPPSVTPAPAPPQGSGNPVIANNSGVDFFQNQNEQPPASVTQSTPNATSTQGTSSPSWRGARAVDIGVPYDITDPASYSSFIASLNGDWTHVQSTSLQHKAALAQAQSEYEAVVANIGALQDAQSAGVCDETCLSAMTVLQNQVPVRRSNIDALQSIVQQDEVPQPPPPPTVAQVMRVADSLATPPSNTTLHVNSEISGGASIPVSQTSPDLSQNPPGPPTVVSVGAQENKGTTTSSSETRGEATILRIIKGIWEFLKALFVPPASSPAPQPTCSLFLSLLGKCS